MEFLEAKVEMEFFYFFILFSVPPPLGTLAPPDKETIKSSSFVVDLTEASNEKGDIR